MSHTAGEGPGETSDVHTFICGTWYSLLQVTSPAPGGFSCTSFYHLSRAQVSSTGMRDHAGIHARMLSVGISLNQTHTFKSQEKEN